MANERLRTALLQRGVTPSELADTGVRGEFGPRARPPPTPARVQRPQDRCRAPALACRGRGPPPSRTPPSSTRHPAAARRPSSTRAAAGSWTYNPDHGEQTYKGSNRLEGKKTVITGGDSGIGRAVALAFAREGADVLIFHLKSEEEAARETVRLVEESGRRAVTVPGDLRDEETCQRVVDIAVREFGLVDVLVSTPRSRSQDGGIADITTEQFDRVMKTNVYALFWLAKAAIRHLTEGSSIITTTSVQGSHPHHTCWATRRPRPRSSTSPRAWPPTWSRRALGSTRSPWGRCGRC